MLEPTKVPAPASNTPSLPQPALAWRERIEGWLKEDRSQTYYAWEKYHSRLRGMSRHEAIDYLAKRDTLDGKPYCVFCNLPFTNVHAEADLNHIDGNASHNERWNQNLAHHPCNSSAQKNSTPPQSTLGRVRERVAVVGVGSELGASEDRGNAEWSVRMNARVDAWLNDMEGGPFVFKTGDGQRFLIPVELKELAHMAASMLRREIGRGSNITTERYFWTRSYGTKRYEPGELEIREDEATGLTMVRYRGKNRFILTDRKESS